MAAGVDFPTYRREGAMSECDGSITVADDGNRGADQSYEGKYIGMVKLGPKSQIVIPKEVRDIFNLEPGATLLMLADKERGIALVNPAEYQDVMDAAFGKGEI